jgi:cytidyltransferase-like protein
VKTVVVTGGFDDLRSEHVRFLEEASRLGALHALLWSDEIVAAATGKPSKFPLAERHYLLQAVRYVKAVSEIDSPPDDPDALPAIAGLRPDTWAVAEAHDTPQKRAYCDAHGLGYHVVTVEAVSGFPAPPDEEQAPSAIGHTPYARKKVMVTGCYDWLHSGHVRFFEEVSELGDLYVAVGNDANVRHLKGPGHPLQTQDERRYMVGAVRYVTQALITSGYGWMDAEPEIERLKPDIYAVNEDGDVPEKRAFCQVHGLEYAVLKRTPKAGLSKRSSTDLRGF